MSFPKICLYAFKGATAYEFQFKRLGVRYTYLRGNHFGKRIFYNPQRRLSVQWFGPGPDYSAS